MDAIPTTTPAPLAAPSDEDRRAWAEVSRWSYLLDSSLRVPGTQVRVGWDGIIGFVPVVGDAAGLALSVAVVTKGVMVGARRWTLARLIGVALLDAALGLIPFLGALTDLAFKANERNLRTMRDHARDPIATEAESRRVVLIGMVGVGTAVVAAAITVSLLVLLLVRWLA